MVHINHPKLILHVDARNTVFVGDKKGRIATINALNIYASGLVWCTESINTETADIREPDTNRLLSPRWIVCTKELSQVCQDAGTQSIYSILEKELVKLPEDRPYLRRVLGYFTKFKEGEPFRNVVEDHLELLKIPRSQQQSMSEDARRRLTLVDKNTDDVYHYILPSFFNLIHWLISEREQHVILIRSYGRDIKHIISAIGAFLDGKHPTIRPPQNIPDAYFQPPRLYELKQSNGVSYHSSCLMTTDMALTSPRDIYNQWNEETGVIGIQDDFEHWLSNDYHYSTAKPLWISKQRGEPHHIIFDDNIRFDEVGGTNVVNFLWLNGNEQQEMKAREVRAIESVNFVQTDLFMAIRNPRYFIDRVCECIRRNQS